MKNRMTSRKPSARIAERRTIVNECNMLLVSPTPTFIYRMRPIVMIRCANMTIAINILGEIPVVSRVCAPTVSRNEKIISLI